MKKNITIKDRLTVDYFDFDNSEWAMEYQDENGKIETIKDMVDYFNDVFDEPIEYLMDLLVEEMPVVVFKVSVHLLSRNIDEKYHVEFILNTLSDYLENNLVESN
jgi:hypothetical protein